MLNEAVLTRLGVKIIKLWDQIVCWRVLCFLAGFKPKVLETALQTSYLHRPRLPFMIFTDICLLFGIARRIRRNCNPSCDRTLTHHKTFLIARAQVPSMSPQRTVQLTYECWCMTQHQKNGRLINFPVLLFYSCNWSLVHPCSDLMDTVTMNP